MKTALVTGGTDGIGKEIARGLALAGNRLILVGRDAAKGARAAQEINSETNDGATEFVQADLRLIRETERLEVEIGRRTATLHFLVHSAGMVQGRHEFTAEGFETNFALNYLSRFALTRRLLPLMQAASKPGAAARIVIIGGAAQNGTIHFHDVNLTRNFGTLRAVSQFCQANDLFNAELAARLTAADGNQTRVTITTLKVGVVKTNIRHSFPIWMKLLIPLFIDPFLAQTPQVVAASALRLLLAVDFEGMTGAFFRHIKKFKRIAPPSSLKFDSRLSLWNLSEQMISRPHATI